MTVPYATTLWSRATVPEGEIPKAQNLETDASNARGSRAEVWQWRKVETNGEADFSTCLFETNSRRQIKRIK
jgi:hypothetical protein